MTTIRADLRGVNGKPIILAFDDERAGSLGAASLVLPNGTRIPVFVTELADDGGEVVIELRAKALLGRSYGTAGSARAASAQRREKATRAALAQTPVGVRRWLPYNDD